MLLLISSRFTAGRNKNEIELPPQFRLPIYRGGIPHLLEDECSGEAQEREKAMEPPEPNSIEFCLPCSLHLLSSWKGWPNRDVIPNLPLIDEGNCVRCGAMAVDLISNRSLTWQNIHGPYNTGLPDYWIIVTGTSKWGLPYFTTGICPKCQGASILSQLAYPDESVEFKHNCPDCGVVAYR